MSTCGCCPAPPPFYGRTSATITAAFGASCSHRHDSHRAAVRAPYPFGRIPATCVSKACRGMSTATGDAADDCRDGTVADQNAMPAKRRGLCLGDGHCRVDTDCADGLRCGNKNCQDIHDSTTWGTDLDPTGWDKEDNCCELDSDALPSGMPMCACSEPTNPCSDPDYHFRKHVVVQNRCIACSGK